MSRVMVIFASDQHWRLGVENDGKPIILDLPSAQPQAVADALREHGSAGQSLVLAIPSGWCLSASIPLARTSVRPSREELRYMLEEHLPVAAEEVAADFLDAGDRTFAVTADLAKLKAIVTALEAQGIAVDAICPEALLALQYQAKTAHDAQALVIATPESADLLLLDGNGPTQWYASASDAANLGLYLRAAASERESGLQTVAHVLPDSPVAKSIADLPGVEIAPSDLSASEQATLAAIELQAGRWEPWTNLRQDELAAGHSGRGLGRPLAAALAMAAVFCLCLTLAMFWRGWQYQRKAADYDRQQQQAFARLYPDRALPPDVSAYLASEQRKLQAMTGQAADAAAPASALAILHDALTRLPSDVRYRLTQMRFADDQVTLEGETRSHSDADTLAAGLRSGERFEIASPRTELNSQGVAFTITGKPSSQRPRGQEVAR